MGMKEQVNQWIKENQSKHIEYLQKLVRLNSTQGNEKKVQENISSFLNDIGLEVDYWDLDGKRLEESPFFYSNKTSFENSPNVIGVLKGTGGGRSIILNGHVDVVPEGERGQWEDDPYSGLIKDGYMYGRGVTDMKGGNASLMIALDALTSLGIRLKGDVIFQSVIEEESGGSGTLDAILKGYQADAALIPEPTNMKIFPKQQGSKWFRLRVAGRTAHGGTRYHGVSAIDKSFVVLDHIKELEQQRNKRITDPLYHNIPIPVPINIGSINGGDWPSSVADSVQLEGRIGIAPDEEIDHAQEEMEQWLQGLGKKDEWFIDHPVEIEWFGARWVPGNIDTDHPLMNTLIDNYKDVLTEDPKIEASPWGTDGGLLEKAGNTPSIIFGPGITELAHFPNESIQIEKVFQAAEIITATLIDWCGLENNSHTES